MTDVTSTHDISLGKVVPLQLTKQEWLVIFNACISQKWSLGDARLIDPIMFKIHPHVAESDQTQIVTQDHKSKIKGV